MSTAKLTAAPVPKIKRRVLNRDKLEAEIAAEAVRVFAECGYEGTSIATVAENAGLSKQNLMYYFPTKQSLYQRVLDKVEAPLIAMVLNACGGNQIKASELLGLNRNTLRKKIRAHSIEIVKHSRRSG